MKMKRTLPVVLVAAVGLLFFRPWQTPPDTEVDLPVTPTKVETTTTAEEPLPKSGPLICPGTWKQKAGEDESGRRYLKVISDGVGQLIIQLDGTQKLVIGAGETVVETVWEVKDETVTFKLTGGKPETAYKRLLALAMDEVTVFRIKELEKDKLVLERISDSARYEWNLQGDPLCYEKTRSEEETSP